jgi:hypothetical protein
MAPSRVSNASSEDSSSADVSMIDAPTAVTRDSAQNSGYLMRVSTLTALDSALSTTATKKSEYLLSDASTNFISMQGAIDTPDYTVLLPSYLVLVKCSPF